MLEASTLPDLTRLEEMLVLQKQRMMVLYWLNNSVLERPHRSYPRAHISRVLPVCIVIAAGIGQPLNWYRVQKL